MIKQRQVMLQKGKEVEEITKIMQQHQIIALASLRKVRAAQLQQLRKKLQSEVCLRVVKNTLISRAMAKAKSKPDIEKIKTHLTGSTIFLFTNLNPFKLVALLEKSKVKTTAKAGDVAAFDVIVPAGNTGQAPGPIISQLGAVGLKTRIESGSVWVAKDTLVVKKGETISERLAAVLSKLGIKPVEAGLVLKTVYDNGMIITEEQLHLDIHETRASIEKAHRDAFILSLNSVYTTPENMAALFRKAHSEAYNLGISGNIATRETMGEILRKAQVQMLALKGHLSLDESTT